MAHLTDKLRGFRKGVSIIATAGVLGLGAIYGCKDIVDPPINNPSQITRFNFSPLSGVSPLPVTTQYKCEDLDGADDIAESYLVVGSDTIPTTSIDTTFIFTQKTRGSAVCKDKAGEGETRNVDIEVSQPPVQSYSHSVEVRDSVNVRYNATLTNINRAILNVKNGNTLIFADTITTPTYTKDLEDIPRDNHFILTPDGFVPDTVTASITNYKPTIDLEGLATDGEEGTRIVEDLEDRIGDINLEHNPVPLISATSLDGRVIPTLEGYLLTREFLIDSIGSYEVELTFGSLEGRIGLDTLRGNVLEVKDMIAFWSNRNEPGEGYNEDIYSMNIDGTDLRRLTTDPGQDLEPTYSPDGKEILFTSHRTRGTAVWRMNADGSNQRDITSSIVERARQADWCSNGKIVVAYRDLGDTVLGIGIVDSDVNSFTPIYSELVADGIFSGWPSWSPDCFEIAFERKVNGNWDVWKMNADGSNLINITNHPAIDGLPSWSPDGNEIVFDSYRGNNSADIYVMSSDGSNVRRLTDDPKIETDPVWSPDGTQIIFSRWNPTIESWQMYLMSSDGTAQTLIPMEGSARYLAWRPRQ